METVTISKKEYVDLKRRAKLTDEVIADVKDTMQDIRSGKLSMRR